MMGPPVVGFRSTNEDWIEIVAFAIITERIAHHHPVRFRLIRRRCSAPAHRPGSNKKNDT